MTNALHTLSQIEVAPELDEAWPGTVVSGDPHTRTWNQYSSADGQMHAGEWESTPGVWRIDYDAWEYCRLVAGHCTIALDGKPPVELRAGDVFVIERGARGTWTVHETIHKQYVFALDR